MTNVLPKQKRVEGEVEKFTLLDTARQVRQVTRQAHALTPRNPYAETTVLDRIASFVPAILPSTNERHERLTTMGLHRLAQSEKLALRVELTGFSYTELNGEDLDLWTKFLPTHYSVDKFAYDSIPDEALDEIETAQSIGCFDSISIWTPEHNDAKGRLHRRVTGVIDQLSEALQKSLDPLAVGIIDDQNGVRHFYAIVRWAESLEPIETIKAYVKKVDNQERGMLIGIPTTLIVIFGLLAIPMHFWVLIPVVVTVIVTGIIALVAADNRRWSRSWS